MGVSLHPVGTGVWEEGTENWVLPWRSGCLSHHIFPVPLAPVPCLCPHFAQPCECCQDGGRGMCPAGAWALTEIGKGHFAG